jgi:hypothetical protein
VVSEGSATLADVNERALRRTSMHLCCERATCRALLQRTMKKVVTSSTAAACTTFPRYLALEDPAAPPSDVSASSSW